MTERVYKPKAGAAQPVLIEFQKKPRYWELDFLRGICVLFMVIDHFFYSAMDILKYYVWEWADVKFWQGLQKFAEIYWVNNARNVMHYVGVGLFCVLCGISCTLSHNNATRGLKALAVAGIITMVTWLADKILQMQITILFGVIHMLACAMLVYSLTDLIGWSLQTLIRKISKALTEKTAKKRGDSEESNETAKRKKTWETAAKWIRWMFPALCGIVGLIVFFALPLGHFGLKTLMLNIPAESGTFNEVEFFYAHLFSDVTVSGSEGYKNFISIFVELDNFKMASSDYFALLPNALLVLVGSGIGRLIYHTRAKTYLTGLDGKWNKPVSFVGRHALLFYLFHQLVIVAFFFAAGGIYSAIS